MGKDHGLFPIPAPQEKKWYNISDKLKEEVENSPLLDFDTQEESWEEQLEELNKKHGYHMTDMGPARWEVLKNFISNLLQKAREEGQKDTLFSYFGKSTFEIVQALKSADTLASLRESIEGMKLYAYTDAEIAPSYPMETSYLKGHNKALQDIIKLLENKEWRRTTGNRHYVPSVIGPPKRKK